MPDADRENLFKTLGDSMLVKRVGEAEDIALAFLYLMKQSFGTGQNLVIDGGSVLV
jgi:NAD(P)-dependent dehydrogenase (short-subunit alcohol dehydrogenase family)